MTEKSSSPIFVQKSLQYYKINPNGPPANPQWTPNGPLTEPQRTTKGTPTNHQRTTNRPPMDQQDGMTWIYGNNDQTWEKCIKQFLQTTTWIQEKMSKNEIYNKQKITGSWVVHGKHANYVYISLSWHASCFDCRSRFLFAKAWCVLYWMYHLNFYICIIQFLL